jgi:ELWxxDGT repeat protein
MTSPSQVDQQPLSSRRRPKSKRRHRDSPPRFEPLEARTLLSLPPTHLADVNTLGASSTPQTFTAVGPTTFFLADDGVHGQELWKTSGATAGTTLVKDINPGPVGFDIYSMTNVNGTLLFFANDGVHGEELWKSDGTAAGTALVSTEFDTRYMTGMNGKVYLSGEDATAGRELFETDGTAAGTTLVKDINPGIGSSSPDARVGTGRDQFAVLGGKLYFGANDGTNGRQLWSTNRTTAGTSIVDNINPLSVTTNKLGTDATGALDRANGIGVEIVTGGGDTIGGSTSESRNVISGNSGAGIKVDQPVVAGTLIEGNSIGSDVTGRASVGNGDVGVELAGSGVTVSQNDIADNVGDGVDAGDSEAIYGNRIVGNGYPSTEGGTLGTGVTTFGNNNSIGGTGEAQSNVIAGNASDGVAILST